MQRGEAGGTGWGRQPRLPPEQGWKPEPGSALPETAYFGKEASWLSVRCVELLTLGNRAALGEQVPATACRPMLFIFSLRLNLTQHYQDQIPNS